MGLIITDVRGVTGLEYVDYYISVLNPTAEFSVGPLDLFARPELRYALGTGYNLLGNVWIRTPYGWPPITIGAKWSW